MLKIKSGLDLSNQERLLIKRRRLGMRQKDAAKYYDVPVLVYYAWEKGTLDIMPNVRVGLLKDHERCLIYRKRSGLEQKDIAKALGLSRYWVVLMENGKVPCRKLLKYWE